MIGLGAEITSYTAELVRHATLLTAVIALVFGILQVRHWRHTRDLSVSLELVQTIRTREFTRAIARVLKLSPGANASEVRADPDLERAAFVVSHAFESLGVLVFYRMLSPRFVDHLLGGYARSSWSRLRGFIVDSRLGYGPSFGEWYEWLVDRLVELGPEEGGAGAYEAHRGWRW